MAAPARPDRRSWLQRSLLVVNTVLSIGAAVAAGGIGYLYWQLRQVPTVDLPPDILEPTPPPHEPQNYLLVGSDTRAGLEGETASFGGDQGPPRADAILLLRLDPSGAATMLSFPRDLWVTLPGGDEGRINTAFDADPATGAAWLIETITANFGVPVHHYVQVDFRGFRELVDELGGVSITLPTAVRDWDRERRLSPSGLSLGAGCTELDGEQALAFVRSRHYETLVDGTWRRDLSSDLGRVRRQQAFVQVAINESLSSDLFTSFELTRLAGIARRNLTISSSIDVDSLLSLARNMEALTAERLRTFELPVLDQLRGRARVLVLDPGRGDRTEAALASFREPVPAATVPAVPDPPPTPAGTGQTPGPAATPTPGPVTPAPLDLAC